MKKPGSKKRQMLRSQLWFDNPDDPGMTALYLERYLNFGLTRAELTAGKPIIGIAQSGTDLSPCNRHHLELAKRVREGIRDAGGIAFEFPVPPDPGDRQAADRGARPQPRLSRSGRSALRLSPRRRRAHHRLRQDHAGLHHGGGDSEYSGHRAVRRTDAQRLVGRARRAPAPWCGKRARSSRPARSTTRNSSTSSPPRRRRSAIATRWARPRP